VLAFKASSALVVLIVENNAAEQRAYERLLRLAGHTICLARTPLGAIEMLIREPIDLVVLDYNLENPMNGLDVKRFVDRMSRKDGRRREVFIVSGYPYAEIEQRAAEDARVLDHNLHYFEKTDVEGLMREVGKMAAAFDEPSAR
jgi:response regulator RpfG family c-di-GMP phosphodiesterase